MKSPFRPRFAILPFAFFLCPHLHATNLDTIGATLLRTVDPSLTGAGVNIGQTEASAPPNLWQVNPAAVGQPVSLFTYTSGDGASTTFPNSVGAESGHANGVGANFYGVGTGVAPGVAHVYNYEANYFYQSIITVGASSPSKIVNQSFVFGDTPPQTTVDTQYDNYSAQNNVLFVSGVGNSGPPSAPATSYNGIGVAAFGGGSSVGPTTDNGRSKPDLTAPADATSFSTPYVSGAAAVLRQAALRNDGGANTATTASDARTLKALLLNGAVKPADWNHTAPAPLDPRYGAGIVNIFNSDKQLIAGKQSVISATSNAADGTHPPIGSPGSFLPLAGWDSTSITNATTTLPPFLLERVHRYTFDLSAGAPTTFTATLVWNRASGQSSPNNLELFFYNAASQTAVAVSTSTVDNVEHIYAPNLPPAKYELQVLKRVPSNPLASTETYALAYEFFALSLRIARTGNNVVVSWPLSPAGFRLESTPNLNLPITWTTVTTASVVTNNENRVAIPPVASAQFFRLARP